jgi:hypothetical protein
MSFFAKTPKVGNIVAKPRAKKSTSDRRRFIPSSTKSRYQIAHIEQQKKTFINLTSKEAHQTAEGQPLPIRHAKAGVMLLTR